jgi:hypothetical protein
MYAGATQTSPDSNPVILYVLTRRSQVAVLLNRPLLPLDHTSLLQMRWLVLSGVR